MYDHNYVPSYGGNRGSGSADRDAGYYAPPSNSGGYDAPRQPPRRPLDDRNQSFDNVEDDIRYRRSVQGSSYDTSQGAYRSARTKSYDNVDRDSRYPGNNDNRNGYGRSGDGPGSLLDYSRGRGPAASMGMMVPSGGRQGHYHNSNAGTQNQGNMIGERFQSFTISHSLQSIVLHQRFPRSSTRLFHAPGGKSSFSLTHDSGPAVHAVYLDSGRDLRKHRLAELPAYDYESQGASYATSRGAAMVPKSTRPW